MSLRRLWHRRRRRILDVGVLIMSAGRRRFKRNDGNVRGEMGLKRQ